MNKREPKMQWSLTVSVWHSPDFGHKLAFVTTSQRGIEKLAESRWKGLGVPSSIVKEAQALASAIVADHLVWRYGVAEELPLQWAGDPDPF